MTLNSGTWYFPLQKRKFNNLYENFNLCQWFVAALLKTLYWLSVAFRIKLKLITLAHKAFMTSPPASPLQPSSASFCSSGPWGLLIPFLGQVWSILHMSITLSFFRPHLMRGSFPDHLIQIVPHWLFSITSTWQLLSWNFSQSDIYTVPICQLVFFSAYWH